MRKWMLVIVSILCLQLFGQEKEEKISADLGVSISSYFIWRGLVLNSSPQIQGWGEGQWGKLFGGMWSSYSFVGTCSENYPYLGFSTNKFKLTLADYPEGVDDFFSFDKSETCHSVEAMVDYVMPDKFPLQVKVATIFWGNDYQVKDLNEEDQLLCEQELIICEEKNNYSTYVELLYPFSIGSTDIEIIIGGVTHESAFYSTQEAAIINCSVKGSKKIKITESFSIPISYQLTFNPDQKTANTVFVLSLF